MSDQFITKLFYTIYFCSYIIFTNVYWNILISCSFVQLIKQSKLFSSLQTANLFAFFLFLLSIVMIFTVIVLFD